MGRQLLAVLDFEPFLFQGLQSAAKFQMMKYECIFSIIIFGIVARLLAFQTYRLRAYLADQLEDRQTAPETRALYRGLLSAESKQ